MVSFTCLWWKHEGTLLQYFLWKPGRASGGKPQDIWEPLWLNPFGIFNFQSCTHWASRNLPIPVRVFLLCCWFLWWFCWLVSALGSPGSLYARLSLQSWEQKFILCVPLLVWLQEELFLVCSPFYLLGQSCNFWASCIRNQELDLIMF